MVEIPMIFGTILAALATLALVVVYVPSVASTTLQFRTGIIPFFRDEYNFELYRTKLDRVTILLGSMFWSSLYTAVLVGALGAITTFLLLWQVCPEMRDLLLRAYVIAYTSLTNDCLPS
jgi:ABC-type glycerol-3-phosphate transport system permease component